MERTNKIIIVPDVHGRIFWRELLTTDLNDYDKIIFLGDYGDPYGYEGINHGDCIRELTDIVQFKRDNLDKVVLLLGNHDLHYIDGAFACSRYSYNNRHRYKDFFVKGENKDLFQTAWECEQNGIKYLFTHAGVSEGWAKGVQLFDYGDTPAEMLNNLFKDSYKPFGMIGRYRGGYHPYGSAMWADINEHNGFGAFGQHIQIFGHTQQIQNPEINGQMWCIDCRKIFVLEDNELKKYEKEA